MHLFLLISLTMTAFAANSVLARLALAEGEIGPADFSAIRISSAAIMLVALVWLRGGTLDLGKPGRWRGVVALTVYVIGFSFAYVSLPAGVGALVLFGAVQVTMFAAALWGGEKATRHRVIGAAIAFGGLIWLMWPAGDASPDLWGMVLMVLAGVGWGAYSIFGRTARDPTIDTAASFVLAVPFGLFAALVATETFPTARGVALALISGMITSGLGYALWYRILPGIRTSTAAIAQLTVPLIAALAGVALMGETMTLRLGIAAALIISGVAFSLRPERGSG